MTAVRLPETITDGMVQLHRVEEAMDARVMGPRLASILGTVADQDCHVVDAKYEPGVRATVLYRVGGRLLRGDLLDDPTDGRIGSRPVVAPGVQLSCFPDDPDLPRLPEVTDPVRLGDVLQDALRDALPGGGRILRCRVDLLRYRPGKRATLAVEVRGPATAPQRAHRLVAKSYHDGRKAAAVAAEAVLLGSTIDPAAPLRFAPVRAHLPVLSLVVQERLSGVPLDAVLRTPGPAAADALRRAAVALAALHRQSVVSRRTRDIDAELARFLVRGGRVAQVAPSVGGVLVDLATRLLATAAHVPAGVVGLVHGDCKPSQFLLRGAEEVVLLDLDSCGRADPAGDVGTFLATLRQRTLREVAARRMTAAGERAHAGLAQVFLGAYLQAAGAVSDVELRQRITWYEAVALERKALRCFARAPRSPLPRALVHRAHGCLDGLEGM